MSTSDLRRGPGWWMDLDGSWKPPEVWPESSPPLPGWIRAEDGTWHAPGAETIDAGAIALVEVDDVDTVAADDVATPAQRPVAESELPRGVLFQPAPPQSQTHAVEPEAELQPKELGDANAPTPAKQSTPPAKQSTLQYSETEIVELPAFDELQDRDRAVRAAVIAGVMAAIVAAAIVLLLALL